MMNTFLEHLDSLQQAVLDSKHPVFTGQSCRCGVEQALYYCMDCFLSPWYCKSCIILVHSHLPFHQIQEWSRTCLRRVSLSDLGLQLSLGHEAGSCPNHSSISKPRKVTIIHTNGVHDYQLEFCQCVDALAEPFQLTCSRLFPATIERPETLFTFDILDHFHTLNLTSKILAYDYWDALVKQTDHVFPKSIPVSQQKLYFCHLQ